MRAEGISSFFSRMNMCIAMYIAGCLAPGALLYGQCFTGTEPECRCTTAPVLCTIDELDNYSFSMTSFQHPADAPSPLCPPQTGTVSNNPTWFAFVAWCTSLTLEVHVENCTPFQGNINGVQIAIYSSCNFNPPMPVACNTSASDCNTNDKTLTMNNLIIGNTYYFLIDGCAGAYCDVEIDVVGVCGAAEIAPWTQDIAGPLQICAGSSVTHIAQDLHGATHYHWYINGVLVTQGLELTSFVHTWNTTGTFQLCVDASNDPCIPESNPPPQNCITVQVFAAEAGTIVATPTPVCPNNTVSITASGYETGPGYQQYIVIANSSGIIVAVVPGGSTSFTHNMCASFTAYSYNYHTSGTNSPPIVGNPVSTITCSNGCCDSASAPFSFVDNQNPVLLSPPASITLTCFDLLPAMPSLTWTDNCDGTGSVAGVQTGTANLCNGGTLTRTWQYTDACGNLASHAQTITINAMPAPTFSNPPGNITVDCSNIPSSAPNLSVTNGGSGGCAIVASVAPTMNGTPNICGGTFSFNWTYTDVCNRTITHVQTVTVTAIPAPVFNPVAPDVTVTCDGIPAPTDLAYSNGGTGTCQISGVVAPVVNGSAGVCGGVIRYQWNFTDQCGRAISAQQQITVMPAPMAAFIAPPADTTINCTDIPSSFAPLAYTNGYTGTCEIAGSADPIVTNNATSCGGTISILWRFTDACNRVLSHTQVITVAPAPAPMWINPPADTTMDCAMVPGTVPSLSYTNGLSGACLVSGAVPGVQTSFDICSGTVVWEWAFTDPCGNSITHSRNITLNALPPVVFLNPPADITVDCNGPGFTIPDLTYTNGMSGPCAVSGVVSGSQSGDWLLCGGTIQRRWNAMDPCGNSYSYIQTITVLAQPPMMWINPPTDVTITCDEVPVDPPFLTATNGMGMGPCGQIISFQPQVMGGYDACGGEVIYYWEWTEYCGATLTHTQHLSVLPAPPPVFNTDTIPPFLTISCLATAAIPLELPYSNGATGVCAIEGVDTATVTGVLGPCGGPITFDWSFVDNCGNPVSFIHTVNALPSPAPQWVDPPANDTLACFEEYEPPIPLLLTNNLLGNYTGPCEHTVWVSPTVSFSNNIYTHIWSYLSCNNVVIEHIQYVLDVPEPEIEILPSAALVCYGDMFDLSSILVSETSGDSVTVTYHTGSPATTGNQLGSTLWTALSDRTFVILARNIYGCTVEAEFYLTVDPLPQAGTDGMQAICSTEGAIDFTDYLSFNADPGGYWIDVDGAGVLLDNPNNVSFTFVDPGTYHFQYVVQINDCPADTSVLTIILSGGPDYTIDTIYCTNSNTMYTVVINGANLGLTSNAGDIVTIPNGIMIENIPIAQTLTFDIWDTDLFCVVSGNVNPPNCDCPSVPAPVNLGNKAVCFGSPIPPLEVSVTLGTTAHWYDAASGGNLIASDVLTFTPFVMAVGTYTYFVEAESIEFPGCVSNTRTPITLTINPLPVVNDLQVAFCDSLATGMLSVDFRVYKIQINGNPANTLSFHATSAEALSGGNPIAMPTTIILGTNILYARIVNANGCVGVAEVRAILNGLPPFTLQTTPASCAGSADGTITILGLSSMDFYTMSFNGTAYSNTFMFDDVAPGSYPIRVINSVTGCFKWDTAVVGPGAVLTIGLPTLTCNSNGTDTDPSDDYYTVEFITTTTGPGLTYEMFANGPSQGSFNYGQMGSITLPANNLVAQLIAIDNLLGCTDTLLTDVLVGCSSDCEITVDALDQICDDNGTPLDPSDDFHTIIVNASVVNGSVGNQYGVFLNGVLTYTFTYGISESFILPVSGPLPTIRLRDVDDPQCFVNLNVGPLVSCSNQCDIPQPDVQYTCDDNGTLDDASDDFYTIVFTVNVTNPGASGMVQVYVDGALVTTAAEGTEVVLTLPADGASHLIRVVDLDLINCHAEWSSILLTPCSTQCIISLNSSSSVCDDNGTPLDPTDDFYLVSWNVDAIFGSASGMYNILLDGAPAGTGTYGNNQMLTVPADGSAHTILIRDQDDNACTLTIPLSALTHCSNDCAISASVSQVYCNNNGTNQTEADDVFYIVVQVNGTNIPSGSWSLQGTAISGGLGETDTLGPYLILNGPQSLVFLATGASCSDNIVVDPPPACSSCDQSIDAGPDVLLDCGTPTTTLTVTSSSPGVASWRDPSGGITQSASVDVSIAGQYIATVTFPDGCVFKDTVIVSADPTLPAVWGGPDMALNCEISAVTLQSQIVAGGAGVTYEWTDINGTVVGSGASLLVSTPGRYFIRIYDPGVDCWSGKDGVDVLDLTNEPSAIIYADPGNILSCVIQFIVLSSEDEPDVIYTWIANGQAYTDSIFEVYEGGKVTLVALDTITKCESVDSITVNVLSEYPIINIAPVQQLSCDRNSVTLDASGSIPNALGIFTWTNLQGDTIGNTSMIQVSNAGEYILTLVDPANGCTSDDTVVVTDISESLEIVDAPDAVLPCDVNGGMLSASLVSPSAGVTYQWQAVGGQIVGSTSGAQITYSGPGTYIVIATNAAMCSDRDTIVITPAAAPTRIDTESMDASCESVSDGSIILGMIEGGTPPYAVFVNGIETSQMQLENLAPGTYLIQVEDALGCMFEKSIVIEAGDDVLVDLETDVNIKQGQFAELEAMVNIPPHEIGTVVWAPSTFLSCDTCLVTLASPPTTTTYTVTVTDIFGCAGTAKVLIRVTDGTLIFIPNVITPGNGDDINDYITVFSNNPNTRIHSLRIFDRWGELVFERAELFPPNIPSLGWDGTFKGKLVNPGVFVYKVEHETRPGIVEILTGDVTVVR